MGNKYTILSLIEAAININLLGFNPPLPVEFSTKARGAAKKSAEKRWMTKTLIPELLSTVEALEKTDKEVLTSQTIETLIQIGTEEILREKGIISAEDKKEEVEKPEEKTETKVKTSSKSETEKKKENVSLKSKTKKPRKKAPSLIKKGKMAAVQKMAEENKWTKKEIVNAIQKEFGGSREGTGSMISHGKNKKRTPFKGLISISKKGIVSFKADK
jgi:hypothetical protein